MLSGLASQTLLDVEFLLSEIMGFKLMQQVWRGHSFLPQNK